MSTPQNPPTSSPRPLRLFVRGVGVALARARFLLLLLGVVLLVGGWETLQVYWDKWTRAAVTSAPISSDTEYWCPMCPGVVSDWPTKCPVCFMTLVRRQKGEMTPLPDGVVARVQLSPYRIQLAGIRTAVVEHRRLDHTVTVSGLLEPSSEGTDRFLLTGELGPREATLLKPGQEMEVTCDALPGEPFVGRVEPDVRRVRVQVDDPRRQLRSDLFAEAKVRVAAALLDGTQRAALERWRERAAVESVARALASPGLPPPEGPLPALLDAAVREALLQRGHVLAVPELSVIDTGSRKVVFVESMAGTFDAVEVQLGRRCEGWYPVRSGLEPGQRVVTAGAVLLDAETRLNPSVAASYFGAGSRTGTAPPAPGSVPPESLSAEDRQLVARQKICPVTEAPLDSMGGPVRVVIDGRPVFVCCDGCIGALRKNPAKYLPRIAGEKTASGR